MVDGEGGGAVGEPDGDADDVAVGVGVGVGVEVGVDVGVGVGLGAGVGVGPPVVDNSRIAAPYPVKLTVLFKAVIVSFTDLASRPWLRIWTGSTVVC